MPSLSISIIALCLLQRLKSLIKIIIGKGIPVQLVHTTNLKTIKILQNYEFLTLIDDGLIFERFLTDFSLSNKHRLASDKQEAIRLVINLSSPKVPTTIL